MASTLKQGRGYYPMPWSVAVDPKATQQRKDEAAARRAHRDGRPHHAVWCNKCSTACGLCETISGHADQVCLVGA